MSRWLDIGQVLFFFLEFIDRDEVEVHKHRNPLIVYQEFSTESNASEILGRGCFDRAFVSLGAERTIVVVVFWHSEALLSEVEISLIHSLIIP